MELNLKDRLIILKSVLPQFDTRSNIKLKNAICEKIQLSAAEDALVIYTNVGNNQYEIGFKSVEAITAATAINFSDEELLYLKGRIDYIDRNGMFSADTIGTYEKFLDALFESEEYQTKWEEKS
jgi:hypothetical protein